VNGLTPGAAETLSDTTPRRDAARVVGFEKGLVFSRGEAEPGNSARFGRHLLHRLRRPPPGYARPSPQRSLRASAMRILDREVLGLVWIRRKGSDEPPPDYVGGLFCGLLLGGAQVITRAPLSA
jgi:hypothetical protein